MLATILGILKIILIVLLCILGMALALILLLLLWPFSYRIKGLFNSETEDAYGKLNVSFLFHIVSVWAEYIKDQGFDAYIKIFGIKIFDYNKWKLKSEQKEEKAKEKEENTKEKNFSLKKKNKINNKNDKNESDDYDDLDNLDDLADLEDSNIKDSNIKENKDNIDLHEIKDDINVNDEDTLSFDIEDKFENKKSKNKKSKKDKNNYKTSFFDKLKRKKVISFTDFLEESFYKIWDFIDSIPDRIENFIKRPKEKIDKIIDTIEYYDKLLNKKSTEYVIDFLKKKGIKIFKHVKPKKAKIYVEYGSDDPIAVTKAMEAYALLIPLLPKNSRFIPLYDEEKIIADVDIKGNFVVGYLAVIGVSIILNKKVRKFIKLVKRG